MYTPVDFFNTVFRGIADPFEFSILASTLIYLAELPSIVSLPVFIAALVAIPILVMKVVKSKDGHQKIRIILVVVLPLVLHLLLVLFVLDPFPRHLIPFIPMLILCAAWGINKLAIHVAREFNTPLYLIVAPLFIYLAFFVYDGEKGFISEPRNMAAAWLDNNLEKGSSVWWYYHMPKGYSRARFPKEKPEVIIEEMHHANHYLSGMGLRNSLPRDYRRIFDSHSQDYIDGFQSLFTNQSDYKEVVRFSENYFMPEYVLTDRLIGNRSRNYLAEIVVFVRSDNDQNNRSGKIHH